MAKEYPLLAFNFKGRIKSLIARKQSSTATLLNISTITIRKIKPTRRSPSSSSISAVFRDLIAYRIVTSLPKCYLKPDESQEEADLRYLYQIANELPGFLEERGFTAEPAYGVKKHLAVIKR